MSLSKTQDLVFELMREASFNSFDGVQVTDDLKAHQELWRGAIMDRASYCFDSSHDNGRTIIDLIKLRDIADGGYNVDTLFIRPVAGKETELESMAKVWGADEVSWIDGTEADSLMGQGGFNRGNPYGILRVWWD